VVTQLPLDNTVSFPLPLVYGEQIFFVGSGFGGLDNCQNGSKRTEKVLCALGILCLLKNILGEPKCGKNLHVRLKFFSSSKRKRFVLKLHDIFSLVVFFLSFQAQSFRAFWGEKSELRRFKDGSILEAVVWSCNSIAERRTICGRIIKHLLER